MKTILVFAIPVLLVAGVAFAGMLFGALLYRAGIRHGVDLIDEHSDSHTPSSHVPAVSSEALPRVKIADEPEKRG